MPQNFDVEWAEPAYKKSGHSGAGLYYLVAKVAAGSRREKKASTQGYHDFASANSAEARAAFLAQLTPKTRKRKGGVSSTPAKVPEKFIVCKSGAREGPVSIGKLSAVVRSEVADQRRTINRELEMNGSTPLRTDYRVLIRARRDEVEDRR
jgi:hypothetical protein